MFRSNLNNHTNHHLIGAFLSTPADGLSSFSFRSGSAWGGKPEDEMSEGDDGDDYDDYDDGLLAGGCAR